RPHPDPRVLLRPQRRRRAGRGGDRHGEVDGAQPRARAPHRDVGHTAVLGREPARTGRRVTTCEATTATTTPTRTATASLRRASPRARGRRRAATNARRPRTPAPPCAATSSSLGTAGARGRRWPGPAGGRRRGGGGWPAPGRRLARSAPAACR